MRRDPDLLLAVSATAGLAAVVWMLATARPPDAARAVEDPPIGSVVRLHGTVRVHGRATLVWSDVWGEEPLHRGDAIYTAAGTAAIVKLADGATLSTDPGTFLVLADVRGDRTKLRVSRGRVSARAGRATVEISSPAATTELGPEGHASVQVQDDRTRVEARSRVAVRALGGTRRIEAAQFVELDEHGVAGAVTALPIALQSPADGAVVRLSSLATPIELRWTSPSPRPVRIEIAEDATFAKRVHATRTARAFPFRASREGVFAWRAVGETGEPVSETRRFSVVLDRAPEAALPRGDEVVYVPEGSALAFQVGRAAGGDALLLEVAADLSFSKPVLVAEVAGDRASFVPPPGDARWHWRVRAARAGAPWSAPSSFRVTRARADMAPNVLDAELKLDPRSP